MSKTERIIFIVAVLALAGCIISDNIGRILLTIAALGLGSIVWRLLFLREEDHEEEHDE